MIINAVVTTPLSFPFPRSLLNPMLQVVDLNKTSHTHSLIPKPRVTHQKLSIANCKP